MDLSIDDNDNDDDANYDNDNDNDDKNHERPLQAHLQPHPGIEQEDTTLRHLMMIMITMICL